MSWSSDGSHPVNLTNHSANDLSPDWSPNGTTIVFEPIRDGNMVPFLTRLPLSALLATSPSGGRAEAHHEGDTHLLLRICFISSNRMLNVFPCGSDSGSKEAIVAEVSLRSFWIKTME